MRVIRGTLVIAFAMMASVLVGLSSAQAVFVDDTPSPSWSVDGPVYATVIVGDTVFVGGQFSNQVSSTGAMIPRKNLAAFSLETGNPVTTFRADATSIVRGLASDGTSLYVAGSFPRIGPVAQARLAKVSVATGAVDTTFAPILTETVRVVRLDGDKLFIGGAFTSVNGVTRSRVANIDAGTGALDPTFNSVVNNTVYGLALDQASRKLFVAGNFTAAGGAARTGVAALNADTGAVAPTVFASAARPTLGLDLAPDGSRLFGAGGGSTNAVAAWDTSAGNRVWRQTANGDIQAVKYFGGSVYFGFHDGYQGDTSLKLLAADAATGVIDPDFRPAFDDFWGVWSLDVSDEGLAVGGDFTTVSGVPARGFARFPRSGSLPPPPPTSIRYIDSTTQWRYWDQGTRPTGWELPGFDASSWPTGLTQLGYGDGDEQTVIGYGPSATNKYLSYYFRAEIDVAALGDLATVRLAADDGAVVYVNGVEAMRDNMPAGTVSNTTRASTGRSGGAENELRVFSIDPTLFTLGKNTVAVEIHQDSAGSGDLSFDMDLDATVAPPANAPPTAAFTSSADNQTVTFDATTSFDPEGPISSYEWNFGDGNTGSGATASHTYAVPGDYTVTLRVADSAGAHDTVVATVSAVSATVTSNVVTKGSTWSYRYVAAAPDPGWKSPGFSVADWLVGNAVLGFGSTVATNINVYATTAERPITSYFRRSFDIPALGKVRSLTLNTIANDGVVVYVNGVEVGRSNMPSGTIAHTTFASSARSAATANANPVTIEVPLTLLVQGTNVIAVETHLNYRGTADMAFDLGATLTSDR